MEMKSSAILGAVVAFMCTFLNLQAAIPSKRMVDITFDEIRMLTNQSCESVSSCEQIPVEEPDNLLSHRCECGPQCKLYDTCCLDSPHRTPPPRFATPMEPLMSCIKIPNTNSAVFMVSRCNSRWRGNPAVINKCQKSSVDSSDPYTLIPATDNRTKVIYKNYFCGICNGVKPEELTLWEVELGVKFRDPFEEIEQEALMEKLQFDPQMNIWGFWHDEENTQNFVEVTITPKRPWDGYRNCVPDMISECHPAWKERVFIQKCRAYTSIVYFTIKEYGLQKPFRNVHCAICNYASLETGSFNCDSFSTIAGVPLTFTLLIDINDKDGSKVGRVSRCPDGKSYDPFAKKCRSLVCGLPGYAVVGNRCEKV